LNHLHSQIRALAPSNVPTPTVTFFLFTYHSVLNTRQPETHGGLQISSLVTLKRRVAPDPVKVPDYWWPGYNGQILHDSKIYSFDPSTQKWNLLLDSNYDDALYLMAYGALCECSNNESSTFHEFQLPHQPVCAGDDEIETTDGTKYKATEPSEWSKVNMHEDGGRSIDPVEWIGGNKEFTVNITAEEVEKLKDGNGEIRCEKVL